MNDMPIYVSERQGRNLWQRYRVYPDRLELQSWLLLHTVVIPAGAIDSVEVRPSIFSGRKGLVWGIKLDNCDLIRHVLLARKSGVFRRIGFCPDDPEKFVEACRTMLREG